MTERPILFSAPMVRAILEGTKTQTRRVLKDHPGDAWVHDGFGRITSKHPKQGRFGLFVRRGIGTDFPECDIVPCPYGQPGDRLWVRETWQGPLFDGEHGDVDRSTIENPNHCVYAADGGPAPEFMDADDNLQCRWRPSIHMPRWASRITLEITRVRVERLEDISADDARAEGCPDKPRPGAEQASVDFLAKLWYHELWCAINGPESWRANPWVWVVEFRRV